MKIVGFGASSMQGVGDPEGGFFKRVAKFFADSGKPHLFVNHGIGGDTTIQMLNRVERVCEEKADMMIVLLGCNDMPRVPDGRPENRTSLEDYGANLNKILSAIRADRSLFITSFEVDENKTGIPPELFRNYMTIATDAATSHGYDIWDLSTETRALKPSFISSDGVHYNGPGHAYIAEKLIPMIPAI